MIKVICLKNNMPGRIFGEYRDITIGSIYDAEERFDVNCYLIKDDNDEAALYHISCFEPLSLYREKRINQILN